MSAHKALGREAEDRFGIAASFADEARSVTPINAYLRTMPPLREQAAAAGELRCKVCGGAVSLFACVDFNKSCHPTVVFEDSGVLVDYHRCRECDFLFTPFCDRWSPRDYAELIYNDDYLKVDGEFLGERARRTAVSLAPSLDDARSERILDYGSGSGDFSAALRGLGFAQPENYDPYTHPKRPAGRFTIVTAFDVIEHSADPVATLRDMLGLMADDGCLLIGQSLQPPDIAEIGGSWWYLAPRNGHISMFSEETVRRLAEDHALDFHNFGAMFALSRPDRGAIATQVIALNQPNDRRVALYAPARIDGEPFGWHPLEEEGTLSFRWTAREEVDLGRITLEGDCELAVPFHIAIDPGFVDHARLRIGDDILPLRRRRNWLVADYSIDRRMQFAVSLLTPPPVRPAATAGNNDERMMGVAVIARSAGGAFGR